MWRSQQLLRLLAVGIFVIGGTPTVGQTTPWRYAFKAGDHLIYRYTFSRRVYGGDISSQTKATYTSHVLILGERNGRFSIGFQRNRESSELVSYRERGRDKLTEQRLEFAQRMAKRDPRFHEANEFDRQGNNFDWWQAVRESPSKLLLGIHEIARLPAQSVSAGDKWKRQDILGFDDRFVRMENVGTRSCARVDGKNNAGRFSYWWCPETGALAKVEFDGEYILFGDARAHETLMFELVERRRGEKVGDWLKSTETQRGALDVLLLSPWVAFPDDVAVVLSSADAETQALAVALVRQRRIQLADGVQTKLAASASPEVARIAKSMPSSPAHPVSTERLGTTFRVSRRDHLPYILHVPKDYRGDHPFPLIIYLSGGGGFAIDAANTSEEVIAPTGYLVFYPQAGGMWWDEDVRQKFAALFEEILATMNVDRSRIFITGFSNGGTGALYYATFWRRRFAALVSMMGAGVCMHEVSVRLEEARDIPTLLLHGDKDEIIPASCSRDTFNALQKASRQRPPQLKIFPGRGHEITFQNDDGLTLKFFEEVGREVAPAPGGVKQ